MTYLYNVDFYVRLVDLPPSVSGAVCPNEDGTFSIYINAKNTLKKQLETLDHEIRHIINDDFYSDLPIEVIESKQKG